MNNDDDGIKYPGVYRGRVLRNDDQKKRGRITAHCEDVHGLLPTTWAEPCMPMTGPGSGMFVVPPISANVWLMFELGDVNHPIWIGCFWKELNEVPLMALASQPPLHDIVLQTSAGYSISVSDKTGIMLRSPGGAVMVFSDAVISITTGKNASIEMTGPSVTINKGALAVT